MSFRCRRVGCPANWRVKELIAGISSQEVGLCMEVGINGPVFGVVNVVFCPFLS